MQIADVCKELEFFAPIPLQEDYDNCGLLTGQLKTEVTGILISLDCTEIIVDEAIQLGYNLIISHHPILFKGLKKLNGNNYIERTIIKAIKNDIAIYAIHTNLDHVKNGVNGKIAEKLNLKNFTILKSKTDSLLKLETYCPEKFATKVRESLFLAGAGNIGNYSEASFNSNGIGTFKGNEFSNGFVGEKNIQHQENETKIEVIFEAHLKDQILNNLIKAHPYEEIAYQIIALKNAHNNIGAGGIGDLTAPMDSKDFLMFIKDKLKVSVIRYTSCSNKNIKKVAVCGGSGSFLLADAIRSNADAFISADFKYHEFFDAEEKILVADIGHYESEQFTQELILNIITNKFPNFAIRLTENNTNPIKYLA